MNDIKYLEKGIVEGLNEKFLLAKDHKQEFFLRGVYI